MLARPGSTKQDWRRLQSSDHFYYMCTKYLADGTVHKYFSPYDSPYDAFINFMNVLDSLRGRLPGRNTPAPAAAKRKRGGRRRTSKSR